ncbi:MAG: LytTR family DNA-binding domain-containing protein [Bacteroidota bacterium]
MSFLERPYSYLDSKKVRLIFAVVVGLLACLFLLVFNPYDALNWTFESPIYNLPLWTAGLFSIPVLLLSQLGIRNLLYKEVFKVKHLLILSAIELFLLSLVFFLLFADQASIAANFWGEVYVTFFYTILMASIIYVFAYLSLPYFERSAEPVEDENEKQKPQSLSDLLNLKNEKGKVEFVVKRDAILYIKSEDNYVSVYHLVNEEVKKKLIRTSLKNITQDLAADSLVRVHRSYMINPEKIAQIEPNKDSFKIGLAGLEDTKIPVSSTYKKNLLALRPGLAF